MQIFTKTSDARKSLRMHLRASRTIGGWGPPRVPDPRPVICTSHRPLAPLADQLVLRWYSAWKVLEKSLNFMQSCLYGPWNATRWRSCPEYVLGCDGKTLDGIARNVVGLCRVVVGNFWPIANFRKIQDGRRRLGDHFTPLSNGKAISSYGLNWIFLNLGTRVQWVRPHKTT